MPKYEIPVAGYNEQTASPEQLVQGAVKQFLKSPTYARQFMNGANAAIEMPEVPEPNIHAKRGTGLMDAELLARTIAAEAGAHPADQPHVASVIMNRVASPAYPNTVRGVIMQPGQFSAWNAHTGYAGGEGANNIVGQAAPQSITELAHRMLEGGNPTTGALNYYNPDAADPAWGGPNFKRIGDTAHVYGTAGQ